VFEGAIFRYDLCMELIFEVREATSLHFEDAAETPKIIQLHFVKDELLLVEAA
jgi:hypothetical protein